MARIVLARKNSPKSYERACAAGTAFLLKKRDWGQAKIIFRLWKTEMDDRRRRIKMPSKLLPSWPEATRIGWTLNRCSPDIRARFGHGLLAHKIPVDWSLL